MYVFLFKDAHPLSPADGEDWSGATWASETDLSTKVPSWLYGLGSQGWEGPGTRGPQHVAETRHRRWQGKVTARPPLLGAIWGEARWVQPRAKCVRVCEDETSTWRIAAKGMSLLWSLLGGLVKASRVTAHLVPWDPDSPRCVTWSQWVGLSGLSSPGLSWVQLCCALPILTCCEPVGHRKSAQSLIHIVKAGEGQGCHTRW